MVDAWSELPLVEWVRRTTAPIVVVDAGGTILLMSPGASKVLGNGHQARPLAELVAVDDLADALVRSSTAIVRSTGRVVDAGLDVVVWFEPIRTHRIVRFSSSSWPGSIDEQTVELAELRRIDRERAALERELRSKIDDLDQVAGVLSHDLAAPARRVRQWAQIAQEYVDEDDLDGAVTAIRQAAQASGRLTGMLVGLTTLLRTGRPATFAEIDLAEVVAAAAQDVFGAAQPDGVDLEVADLGRAFGSPALLATVVANVFSNASRYGRSPDGRLEVGVTSTRVGDEVELVIADRGSGVAPEQLPYMVRPFWRGTNADDVDDSLGIGLAIARRAMEGMDGRFEARNGDGGGLEVALTLPAPP